jgi:hypothetical protein
MDIPFNKSLARARTASITERHHIRAVILSDRLVNLVALDIGNPTGNLNQQGATK